jgi:hypothetical protein
MVWYRHWLEIRFRMAFSALFILLMTYVFRPGGQSHRFQHPAIVEMLGAEGARSFNTHAAETAMLVVVLALMSAGTGIVSHAVRTGKPHRSTYYTLGLPVSRTSLFATRFAAGWLQAWSGFALALVLNCAVLAWQGRPVPLSAMALASLAGVVVVLPATALTDLIVLIFGATAGGSVSIVGILLLTLAVVTIWNKVLTGFIPWVAISVAFVLAAAFFAATVALIRRREF